MIKIHVALTAAFSKMLQADTTFPFLTDKLEKNYMSAACFDCICQSWRPPLSPCDCCVVCDCVILNAQCPVEQPTNSLPWSDLDCQRGCLNHKLRTMATPQTCLEPKWIRKTGLGHATDQKCFPSRKAASHGYWQAFAPECCIVNGYAAMRLCACGQVTTDRRLRMHSSLCSGCRCHGLACPKARLLQPPRYCLGAAAWALKFQGSQVLAAPLQRTAPLWQNQIYVMWYPIKKI